MKKILLFVIATALTFACAYINPGKVIITPVAATIVSTATIPSEAPLPTSTQTPKPAPTPIAMLPTATTEKLIYVVQSGDTLTSIAREYSLTVEYIAGLNSIPDVDTIYVGQVLQLTGVVEIPKPTITTGKQIIVKLSVQRVYVYQDGQLVQTFTVSTGTTQYPTRIGEYRIWIKLELDRMTGPGYDLPDVPWVMYFDEGRGFHGTYWHNNFGRPMSHGCVNMYTPDAEWLFNWAEVGTNVSVIP